VKGGSPDQIYRNLGILKHQVRRDSALNISAAFGTMLTMPLTFSPQLRPRDTRTSRLFLRQSKHGPHQPLIFLLRDLASRSMAGLLHKHRFHLEAEP
jgi:hypothetical protein